MKCPVCIEKSLKSTVNIGTSMSTCMGFSQYYDEEGNLHVHDPNRMTTSYHCSKGHRWSNSRIGHCSSCDFGHNSDSVSIQNSDEIIHETVFASDSIMVMNGFGICSSSSAPATFLTLT